MHKLKEWISLREWQELFSQDRLLALTAIFLPLLFFSFFFLPTSPIRTLFYISIPFSLALILRDRRELWGNIKQNKWVWAITAIFLSYISLSVMWSDTNESGRYFDKGKIGVFIMIAMLATTHIAGKFPPLMRTLSASFITAALLSGIYLIITYASHPPEDGYYLRLHGLGRADNPVQAALLYGLAIIAIAFTNISVPKRLAAASIPLAVILLTQSRGPLLALLVTLSILVILRARRKILTAILLSTVLLGGIFAASIALQDTHIMMRKTNGRSEIWQSAITKIKESPVIGYGLANKTYYTYSKFNGAQESVGHAHSIYLSTLIQGGLIGFALLISLMVMTFWRTIPQIATRPEEDLWPIGWITMGALLGVVDFGGYVINVSTEWLVFWWPVALIFMVPALARSTLSQKV